MITVPDHRLGFETLANECDNAALAISGHVPAWLNGKLLRVGPACFDIGGEPYEHWFDGLSMLHRFSFDHGTVGYRNRYLRSQTYQANIGANAIRYGEFATTPKRWRDRVKSLVTGRLSDNANVAVAPLGGEITALTETPTPLIFDPDTLATIAAFEYDDDVPAMLTTAHPLYDAGCRQILNYTVAFGRRTHYHIYRLAAGARRRELISSLPVKRPGYMHSFAATPHYVLLIEWPLTVNPLRLAASPVTGTPFIDNYRWQPNHDTRVLVIERATGRLVRKAYAPAGFGFHHVNAWEEDDDIVLDTCLYDDASIIDCFRLSYLNEPDSRYPRPRLTRLRVHANATVSTTRLAEASIELPAFNRRYSMAPYRYVYGVGQTDRSLFNALVKIDTQTGASIAWQQSHCYAGEPVFVAAPENNQEDSGILLSLVLDAAAGCSFLLIVDAETLTEQARVHLPHAVPFGFHGLYLASG